jgi:alpha-tubulin suppressor-like RCC1 family protein
MDRKLSFASLAALATLACGDGGSGPRVDPSIHIVIPAGVDSQVVSAGDLVPVQPAIKVEDDSGNPIAGRAVHFQVIAGGGSLVDPDVVTAADGTTFIDDWRLGAAGGRNALKATVENGPSVTIVAYGVEVGMTAGQDHTCGISTGGIAQCWGDNDLDQLGDGSGVDKNEPVPVNTSARFFAIAAGENHTCGISRNGATYCWGDNSEGQLGNNSQTSSPAPVRVAGNQTLVQISAGSEYTCGLDIGGVVWCWGSNGVGEVGDGTGVKKLVPTPVVSPKRFVALDAGTNHACALSTTGQAFCWGNNEHGGTGNIGDEAQLIPVPAAAGHTFVAINAGFQHSCAVTAAQTAFCWGLNNSGQLGTGATVGGVLARQVVDTTFFLPWVAVAGGEGHSCGLIDGGEAYCWGSNFQGALGDDSGQDHLHPSAVSGGFTFSSLTSFGFHTCGHLSNGFAACWGSNVNGQLGNAGTSDSPVPVAVESIAPFLGR